MRTKLVLLQATLSVIVVYTIEGALLSWVCVNLCIRDTMWKKIQSFSTFFYTFYTVLNGTSYNPLYIHIFCESAELAVVYFSFKIIWIEIWTHKAVIIFKKIIACSFITSRIKNTFARLVQSLILHSSLVTDLMKYLIYASRFKKC